MFQNPDFMPFTHTLMCLLLSLASPCASLFIAYVAIFSVELSPSLIAVFITRLFLLIFPRLSGSSIIIIFLIIFAYSIFWVKIRLCIENQLPTDMKFICSDYYDYSLKRKPALVQIFGVNFHSCISQLVWYLLCVLSYRATPRGSIPWRCTHPLSLVTQFWVRVPMV